MKRAILILVGALVILLILRALRDETPSIGSTASSPSTSSSQAEPGASSRPGTAPNSPTAEPGSLPKAIPPSDPLVGRTADGKPILNQSLELSRQLHNPDEGGDEDVAILDGVFWHYQKVFGENPVASQNSDVIRALTGDNPKRVVFFDPNHPSIDSEGRLLDRWGNPYQFHALTEKKLDVWSAGEDGKFGTLDDVQLGLEEGGLQLQAED